VHTRRLEDPEAAFERLLPLLSDAAKSHDLDVEPGRWVVEVRAHGMNKGSAVRRLTDELGARAFVFCGDDLGDVEAFKAIEELRGQGFPSLLVCSASDEENALAEMADVVVAGPDGVLELLRELTADIKHSRA
jgi:trehalose 6-phosphate phosphatase